MNELDAIAVTLALRRLERDRKIALEAGLPSLLKLSAYLPQCRRDAAVFLRFRSR